MTITADNEFAFAEEAAAFLLGLTALRPTIGVVLGSGLGAFADELTGAIRIPYSDIPHFPVSTAIGHAGQFVIGCIGTTPIAVMQGRVHLYEGYSAKQAGFPMRVCGRMGIRTVILTNAAGGINHEYSQGALVLIRDHINLQGQNPLAGANDERLGARFPDMTEVYSSRMRLLAQEGAAKLRIGGASGMREGVYVSLLGPNYETPAEIRYLRTIGADLVGMSTVPEVLVARHMGMEVLAISCVTNMAAGILDQPIHHQEVLDTGERIKGQFMALLSAVVEALR